jgi:hypothetical protein
MVPTCPDFELLTKLLANHSNRSSANLTSLSALQVDYSASCFRAMMP